MKNPRKFLKLAAKIARIKLDGRHFYHGAVAIRSDDVMVAACNGAPKQPCRQHHCESRIARKLDRGSVVYLTRTLANGEWANSKPCADCERALRRAYVKRIYYTVSADEWACMVF